MLSGVENNSNIELVTSYYPHNYTDTISTSLVVKLPQKRSQLNRAMCGMFRTGVDCGNSTDGYTTYFHSPTYQCKLANSTCKWAGSTTSSQSWCPLLWSSSLC